MIPTAELVILRHFDEMFEANLACGYLIDAGIPAEVEVDRGGTPAVPGTGIVFDIRLVVPVSRKEEAELHLRHLESSQITEEELTLQAMGTTGGDWDVDEEDGPEPGPRSLTCPECGSRKVGFGLYYYVYFAVLTVALSTGLVLRLWLDSYVVGTIALLPGLALLAWGFMNRHRIPRICFNCDHRGVTQEFQLGDD